MFRRSKIVFQRKFIKKISQAKDRRCLMALHESAEDYLEALVQKYQYIVLENVDENKI